METSTTNTAAWEVVQEMRDLAPTCENDWRDMLNDWADRFTLTLTLTQQQGGMDALVEAYRAWPDDIRRKLSVHDLRRMGGWAPHPNPADWGIDTSAGRPILVYQKCSVIEAEQARYVLGLVAADAAKTKTQQQGGEQGGGDGVTDDIVERACEAYLAEAKRQNFNPSEVWARSQQAKDWMRAALTAALRSKQAAGG